MTSQPYKLPFRPTELIEARDHERTNDMERSLEQHISVLLRTAPGEVPGDPDYGCHIWDHLAEPIRGELWLTQLTDDVRRAVVSNEKRLGDVIVELKPGRNDPNELVLSIEGRMIPTAKPFRYERFLRTDPIRIP